jgi:hypothetical protein
MTTINAESIVGREIREGLRHVDGKYKLRHMSPYQQMIVRRSDDIEEETGGVFKLKFNDGCILSFYRNGDEWLPCSDGNWKFLENDEHVHHFQRGRAPITGLGL